MKHSVKQSLALILKSSGNNAREVILVNEKIIVSWLASAEQACMAVQVIISFYRTHDIGIYDRARVAVPY